MRLVTFSQRGSVRAGAMLDDRYVVDLNRADSDLPSTLLALLADDSAALDLAARTVDRMQDAGDDHEGLLAAGVLIDTHEAGFRFEAPLRRPPKVFAIGLNYRLHAEETGQSIPERPIVFAKFANTIIGPGAAIEVPRVSHRVDWEGELCVVIGRGGRHIAAEDALDHVAGYMNGNDVSVRDWQAHAATWTMGKNFDTHGPIGPWIATTDEVPDPSNLMLRTWVNGVLKQESSTSDLIFPVPALIEYLSTAITLEPGDVIFTGTPSGIGQVRVPREWLKPGDTVRVEISGLGVLENPVVAERA